MRTLIEGIIDPEDIKSLKLLRQALPLHNFTEIAEEIPSFARLVEYLDTYLPEKPIWRKPSYFRICSRSMAFEKHYDGVMLDGKTKNHMPWCRYSVISDLSKGYRGGSLRLYNPKEVFKKSLYCSALVFSSAADNEPQLHSRDKHDGKRSALLMFLATKNSES